MSGVGAGREVAVIGGGIIGAAVTLRLAEAGARVTLLDAGEPGQGTSSSSFAWLNSSRKEPRAYHDLNVAGIAEHAALATESGAAPWLHRSGGLHWSATPEGEAELRAQAMRLAAWDYPLEAIAPWQARELEPGLHLDPEAVRTVWYAPREGWCDVPQLIGYLLDRARERGATVLAHDGVTAIEQRGGRVTGLHLASGAALPVEIVVICAGPRTDAIAALLGVTLPIDRIPGLLAVSAPVTPGGRCVCLTDRITFRPDPSGGLVMAHADDLDRTVSADTPRTPPPPACTEALERAGRFFPAVAGAGLASARIGVRPLPADDVSIVGLLPGFANAYVAVTHSGVTLGPLLGRLLAGEIATAAAPAQLAPFRPDRFLPGGGPDRV